MPSSKERHQDPMMDAIHHHRQQTIRRLHEAGVSQVVIADAFGITRQAVYYIVHQTGPNKESKTAKAD